MNSAMQAQTEDPNSIHRTADLPETGSTPVGVSVVVVNWNGRHLLERCLNSLIAQDYPNFEIVLVDNGSADGSVEFVRANYRKVRIVESSANLGYAGGCNLGFENSANEYVVLLNNDTKLSPTLLSRLVRTLDEFPRVAAVAGLAVSSLEGAASERPRIPLFGVTAKHFLGTHDLNDLFYAPGACLMLRRSLSSPPFDSDYFAYDEDVYLSWRLRLLGHTVTIDPNACFEHDEFSTSRRIKEYVTFRGERNRWTNLLIFYQRQTLAKVAPIVGFTILAKLLSGTQGLKPKLHAYLWIALNLHTILSKRAAIQSERVASDAEITRHMTAAIAFPSNPVYRLANRLVSGYLRVVGVPTLENAGAQC